MKEKNHHVLKEALAKLGTYRAPDHVWELVEAEIADDGVEELRAKLAKLPVYQAPEDAWEHIQGQLRGRTGLFTRRFPWLVAACFVLIAFAGIFWLQQEDSLPMAPPPMTEKKSPVPEMTEAPQADFRDKMAEEEAQLKACLALKKNTDLPEELAAEVEQLNDLTQTLDSLSFFLTEGKGRPGTSPRMDRLGAKRSELIQKLRKEICESE